MNGCVFSKLILAFLMEMCFAYICPYTWTFLHIFHFFFTTTACPVTKLTKNVPFGVLKDFLFCPKTTYKVTKVVLEVALLILNKMKCFLGQIHIQDAVMVPNWWATFNQGIYKLKNKVTNSQHYMKTSFILLIWINYSLWNNKT